MTGTTYESATVRDNAVRVAPRPRQDPRTRATADPKPAATDELEHRILIVEDNPALLESLSIRLRAAGFDTALALDGANAMIQVREKSPDAILIDVGLPDRDGLSVLERVRRERPGMPAVVITGQQCEALERHAHSMGVGQLIHKPFDGGRVVAALRRAIEGVADDEDRLDPGLGLAS